VLRFHVKTFGGRLLVAMLLMSAVAALFVCVSLVTRHTLVVRRATLAALETHSDILRTHSVAALRFADPEAGAETLAAVRAVPAIRRAEILLPDGRPFAVHDASGEGPQRVSHDRGAIGVAAAAPADGPLFVGRTLVLSRPITHDGDLLGTMRLHYDMSAAFDGTRIDIVIAASVALVAMGLSLAMGLHLKKTLARPIRELVGVARSVAEDRDYSQRAVHDRTDDLGEVMDAFNSMLATIEQRQGELQRAYGEMEQRVEERTAELAAAKARAEAASRSKSDFLANMSHEIRTPMTAILGFGEMLEDPNRSASQRLECVQTIRRNGLHLLNLINDILDISKIEAGRMTIEACRSSVIRVVADVEALMRLRAAEKGLVLRVEYVGPIPESIQTDPTRLRQILVNLIGNAVKFTERGTVTLRVQLKAARGTETEAALRLDIIDTGIGLSAEQISRLFQPFAQADQSVTRRFGGSGLGLTISQQLAELLGGGVTVTSELGEGSTFSVTVATGSLEGIAHFQGEAEIGAEFRRIEESSGSKAASAPLPVLRGRILLAEDGYDNQRLIRAILTAAGAQVTVVENGLLACEEIARSEAENAPYDMIFMDMQMPEMDGYTATGDLRKKGCRLPIVALTAHALTGDAARCVEAGCDEYMSKPVDRRKLIVMAATFMPHEMASVSSGSGVGGAGPEAAPDGGPKRRVTDLDEGATQAPAGTSGEVHVETPVEPLRSELADDPAMTEVIATFLSALPERIHQIERVADEGDAAAIETLAQRLSGAGSGYGFPAISQVAEQLRDLARERGDREAIEHRILELKHFCLRARAAVDEQ